nr:PREDICTED: uncharacterized protein LOC103313123 [Tribolium castaneum]|eukprot:XP_008193773.1 PREDICTED: uncharacterized protein LOC103313123 [Tribolium castaneum]
MRFSFKDNAPENPIEWMQNAIEELLAHIFRGFSSDDYVGLVLENEEFPERPVYISFRKLSQYNVAMVMETVGNVLQSNRAFFVNDRLSIRVDRVALPVGKGFRTATDGLANVCVCVSRPSPRRRHPVPRPFPRRRHPVPRPFPRRRPVVRAAPRRPRRAPSASCW